MTQTRFFLLGLLACISTAPLSAGCDDEIYRWAPRIDYMELAFEAWYPHQNHSLRAINPRIYNSFLRLYQRYPSFDHMISQQGVVAGTTYRQLLDRHEMLRNEVAAEVDDLARKAMEEVKKIDQSLQRQRQGDRVSLSHKRSVTRQFASNMVRLAERLRITEDPQQRGRSVSWYRDQTVREAVGETVFRPDGIAGNCTECEVQYYLHTSFLYSQWAEMRFALVVPELKEYSPRLGDIDNLKPLVPAAVRKGVLTEADAAFKIDIVYQDGIKSVWAEVKSFVKPLRLRTEQFTVAVTSLDKYADLRRLLNLDVRIELVLVNGITPDAKQALMDRYSWLGENFAVVAPEVTE